MSFISLAALGLWASHVVGAVPSGFPTSGNGLWYSEPAVNWSTQYLPIGNGYLGGMFYNYILSSLSYGSHIGDAAMINGDPVYDRIQLNLESLWSGGPFQDPVRILTFDHKLILQEVF